MGKEQGKVQAEVMQAYRDTFLYTPQGQVILRDMMRVSGLLAITGVRPDRELQHMEGAKDMVRRILAILALDEEQIGMMATGRLQMEDIETGEHTDG